MQQFRRSMALEREPWVLLETHRFMLEDAALLQYPGVLEFLQGAWEEYLQLRVDYMQRHGDSPQEGGETAEELRARVFSEAHIRAQGILRGRTSLPPLGSSERDALFAALAFMKAELTACELQIAP